MGTDSGRILEGLGGGGRDQGRRLEREPRTVSPSARHALDPAIGRWTHALRVEISAARAALSGDRPTAVTRYREAFGRFRDLGTPLLLATSVIGACRLLGPVPELAPAIAEAREILVGLRAAPFLGQLEAAVGRELRPGCPERGIAADRGRSRRDSRWDTLSHLRWSVGEVAASMVCSNCGTENEAGRKFCTECAARLGAGLPGMRSRQPCRREVLWRMRDPARAPEPCRPASATARPAPPTAPVAPVAERRLVSVLFADLVGFTALAEGRDAEETRELLTRYFDLAPRRDRALRRHGREVHRRRGDGGLGRPDGARGRRRAGRPGGPRARGRGPDARPVDPGPGRRPDRRGRRHDRRRRPGHGRRRPREHRVPAPVGRRPGHRPRRRGDRSGPRPRRSPSSRPASSCSRARPRRSRPGAPCASSPSAVAASAPRPSRPRSSAATTSCACSRISSTRPAARSGPGSCRSSARPASARPASPGSSSSTSTASSSTVWWHDGRSPAYGDGISFWALGEMVRRRAGLARDRRRAHDPGEDRRDPRDARPRRGRAALDRAGPPGAPRRRVGRRLGAAVRRLADVLRALAATAPVVMVFEDLHFADAGLLDFVDHLLEWSRDRPDLRRHARPPRAPRARARTGAPASATSPRSTSSRCPEPAMRELLAGLVPGLPESAIRAIVARADGIPLYAVETVRMLLADGQARPATTATYRPVGRPHEPRGARRRSPRSSRPASTAWRPTTAPSSPTPPCWGRASPWRARGRLGSRRRRSSSRACGARPPRAPGPRDGPPQPRSGASTRSSRRSSARSPTTRSRSRDRKRRHLAAARFFESLGHRRARGRPGRPLPRRPRQRQRGSRGRRPRRPGPDRPRGGRGAGRGPRLPRPGPHLPPAGPHRHDRPGRGGRAPRAGRRVRLGRRPPRLRPRRSCAGRLPRTASEAIERRRRERRPPSAGRSSTPYRTEQALAVLEPAAEEFADLGADPRLHRAPRPARPCLHVPRGARSCHRGRRPGACGGRAGRSRASWSPIRW